MRIYQSFLFYTSVFNFFNYIYHVLIVHKDLNTNTILLNRQYSVSLFEISLRHFSFFFTLPYRVWSSIEIVHEKSGFFASLFSKYLKNGTNYFD